MKPFQARFLTGSKTSVKALEKLLWMTLLLSIVETVPLFQLLAPNQDIYLRENIRSRLLIASSRYLAIKTEIYQQSLEAVSTGYAPILIPPIRIQRLS